jgi:hypothetical protein
VKLPLLIFNSFVQKGCIGTYKKAFIPAENGALSLSEGAPQFKTY